MISFVNYCNIMIKFEQENSAMMGCRTEISKKIKEALDAGVHVTACKACADQLGVTETLEKLHVEVKYWGVPLTEILQSNEALLTI